MKIRFVGAEFFHAVGKMDIQTDGHTEMAKVTVVSRKFYDSI